MKCFIHLKLKKITDIRTWLYLFGVLFKSFGVDLVMITVWGITPSLSNIMAVRIVSPPFIIIGTIRRMGVSPIMR